MPLSLALIRHYNTLVSEQKPSTDLQHLIRLFQDALTALGKTPASRQLEKWSILVHTSMSGGERNYHGVQHVFDVTADAGPVETLAGLFHDTVCVQSDGYLPRQHTAFFADLIEKHGNEFVLRPYGPEADRHRAMLEVVFGLAPGQVFTATRGLSEFLSAMLAVRSLRTILPDELLIQIATGIEATIPFRPLDPDGDTAAERLFRRLTLASRQFHLPLEQADLERAIHQAVALANRDIAVFAFPDTGRFLDSTWQLLPESVMALRRKDTYTLSEYQTGLHNMAKFFAHLAPNTVFCQFRGVPDQATISRLTTGAAVNIERTHRYLQAKLAASSILYALAVLTGGDAPAALFTGDLPTSGRRTMRLEDFLPALGPTVDDGYADVFALLAEGRRNESGFDTRNSPLAAYLYATIGPNGIERLTASAAHVLDMTSARHQLSLLPGSVLNDIIRACARIAVTRAHALLALVRRP